jgi:hypothetical protein
MTRSRKLPARTQAKSALKKWQRVVAEELPGVLHRDAPVEEATRILRVFCTETTDRILAWAVAEEALRIDVTPLWRFKESVLYFLRAGLTLAHPGTEMGKANRLTSADRQEATGRPEPVDKLRVNWGEAEGTVQWLLDWLAARATKLSTKRWPTEPQPERSKPKPKPKPIVSLGSNNYKVGGQEIIVDDREDEVLQAFFQIAPQGTHWVPLTKPALVERSGRDDAARILKVLQKKHQLLSRSIDCPGKKGLGGLKVYLKKS